MTRKHFQALAEALKEINADNRTIDAIAKVCSDSNPSFNWPLFKKASGYRGD